MVREFSKGRQELTSFSPAQIVTMFLKRGKSENNTAGRLIT